MPAYRFFKKEPFNQNQTLTLHDEEFHHLKNVMRHKEGDSVEVINGMGGLAFAEITKIDKKEASLQVNQIEFFKKEDDLILLQAVPKIHKLDLIIEKGTELGMGKLCLFKGERGDKMPTEEKLKRLEVKAVSAIKQSGRFYLPQIEMISPIELWENTFHDAYYGDVSIDAPPIGEKLSTSLDRKTLYFCCGPEAGFSEKEIQKLKERNFLGVSLHTNILRTETAPLVFLSLAHHHLRMNRDGPIIN